MKFIKSLFVEAANSCDVIIKSDADFAIYALRLKGELLIQIEHFQAAEQLYLQNTESS